MLTHWLYEVFQFLAVAALVLGSTLYCLLTLAPEALKQVVKKALLRCRLPKLLTSKMVQTGGAGRCGSQCGSCASNAQKTHSVQWHPRKSKY